MRKINVETLRIHAEDAGFVLSQREISLEAPNYRLIDIYDLEQRLSGHLDALVFAGRAGAETARTVASEAQDGEGAAVLLHVALRQRQLQDIEFAVAQAKKADDPAAARSLMGAAAAWCPTDARAGMRGWIMSSEPLLRWLALDVCGRHRLDPGRHLQTALADTDAEVRARAAYLAGELGRTDCLEMVRACEGAIADLAAVLLGDRRSAAALAAPETFPRDAATARRAAELFPLGLGQLESQDAIRGLLAVPDTRRWGIVAVGAVGSAKSLPWLVDLMDDPLYARVAVSAFEQISGLYLAHESLELPEFPESPENPIVDNDPGEFLIEENTPWPDPPKVATWLSANAKRFPADEHLLFGVAAWTHSGPPEPWLRYQARFRGVALAQAMSAPGARCPNWRSAVALDGRQFGRAW